MAISPGRRAFRPLTRCHRPWPGSQTPTNPPSRRARPGRSRIAVPPYSPPPGPGGHGLVRPGHPKATADASCTVAVSNSSVSCAARVGRARPTKRLCRSARVGMVPKSISSWWRATRVRDVLGVRPDGPADEGLAAGGRRRSSRGRRHRRWVDRGVTYARWLRASNRASHQASVRGCTQSPLWNDVPQRVRAIGRWLGAVGRGWGADVPRRSTRAVRLRP
jgi:hypothetical protein